MFFSLLGSVAHIAQAAYSYRSISDVVLLVGLSVGNENILWKNGRLIRDAVKVVGRVGQGTTSWMAVQILSRHGTNFFFLGGG